MREGCGTFEELSYLWESLNDYCRWCLVEEAYGMKRNCEKGSVYREDMPSQEETMKMRAEADAESETIAEDPLTKLFKRDN